MIRVLFVCHGNICRSPMAEFLLKDYVNKMNRNHEFYIASAATSSEEIGNPVHYGTKRILNSLGIDCSGKVARRIKQEDFRNFDYIIGMDHNNINQLKTFFKTSNKIYALLEFANENRDIRDPWYTGDFQETYDDIVLGIKAFLQFLGIKLDK